MTDTLQSIISDIRSGSLSPANRSDDHDLADRLERIDAEQRVSQVQHGTTHWDDCWKDRGHHACAVARIDELRERLAVAERAATGVAK